MTQRGILALIGGGEFQTETHINFELLKHSPTNPKTDKKEVLIIPTASAYENPAKKIQQAENCFANLNTETDFEIETKVLKIYTRSEVLSSDTGALKTASVIYLTDGSPMHLRSLLKNSEIFEAIKSAWQNGAVLVGAGAGGDVLCDYMVDARGGAFTVGLRLITEISMIPRYDLWSDEKISRTITLAPKQIFVAGIPHQTALISPAGEPWQQLGTGKIDIFRDGEKSKVEDLPQL